MAYRPKIRGSVETKFDIGLGKVDLDTTAVTTPYTFKFPADAGTNNYVLKTDGSGNLSWVAQGSGSPGGSSTQVQYNSSGSFAGSADFTWDNGSRILSLSASSSAVLASGGQLTVRSNGQALTVKPADNTTTSGGNVTVQGGASTNAGSSGGSLLLAGGVPGSGGGGGYVSVSATNGGTLRFSTNATERLRILDDGSWSVGSAGTNVGTSGYVLTSNGSGSAPTWQAASGGVSSLTGTTDQVSVSASTGAVTISLPSTIVTPGSLQTTGNLISNNGSLTVQGAANVQQIFTSTDGQQWQNGYNAAGDIFGTYDITASDWAWYVGNGTSGATTFPRSIASTSTTTGTLVVGGGIGVGGRVTADSVDVISRVYLNGSAGSAGQVLTSQGSGSAPTWATAAGGGSVYYKDAVRVATIAAGTLATSFENGDSVDGVTLVTGDRILIKNQSSMVENGIYTVNASGAPTRATDADTDAELVRGVQVYVAFGNTNAGTTFQLMKSNQTPIVVGTSTQEWNALNGANVYSVATQPANVVSGSASVAFGFYNVASNTNAISVGSSNTASGSGSLTLGRSNTATTTDAISIGHTNTNGGTYSIILSRSSTIGSTSTANNLILGAGTLNNYNNNAVLISPPTNGTTVPTQGSSTERAYLNLIGASHSVTTGTTYTQGQTLLGYSNTVNADVSHNIALGTSARTTNSSEMAFAGGSFGTAGDAQASIIVARVVTTDATPVEVRTSTAFQSSSTSPSGNIILLNDSSYIFDCDIVARNTSTDTQTAAWNLKFVIRRGAAAANTAIVGTAIKTVLAQDTSTETWDVGVSADTTNGRPAISVTGEAAKTIRWVCNARVTKVTG